MRDSARVGRGGVRRRPAHRLLAAASGVNLPINVIHVRKPLVALVVPAVLMIGGGALAACGSSDPAENDAATQITVPAGATLIDVRMPDEYAAGHLEGAVNIPLEDGSLEAALATLSADDDYVVYCRTGRRSEIAAGLMAGAGLAKVTDLGGFDEARNVTGLDVVTQ